MRPVLLEPLGLAALAGSSARTAIYFDAFEVRYLWLDRHRRARP
jgi:hypothetical protein